MSASLSSVGSYPIPRSLCVANCVFVFATIGVSVVGLNAGADNYDPNIANYSKIDLRTNNVRYLVPNRTAALDVAV